MRTLRTARRGTGTIAGLVASTSLVVGGIVATTTAAHAAPDPLPEDQCPAAFPAGDLTPGLVGTGWTTAGNYTKGGVTHTSATTPESFTATYKGTVEDATGDLYVFDLEGSRITNADGTIDAGVWAGISGSPVYASNGELIGSVSYTFIDGNTNSAGVTPAADLYELRDRTTGGTPASVSVSSAEQKSLRKAGASAAVDGKATRLKRLSGANIVGGVGAFSKASGDKNATARAIGKIAKRAGISTPVAGGGTSTSSAAPTEIAPGGNVAFADSYGSLPYYSLGTATAVCDDVVVAYGHAGNFREAVESMHSAETVSIERADGIGSFKLGNLGPALGTQIADGLNGVLGRVGTAPTGTTVTTHTAGVRPQESTTNVPNPEALPFVVASQVSRDLVVATDRYAGGEAIVSWTIGYTADGTAGSYTRSNRYSDDDYLPDYVGNDVASDLSTLNNQSIADLEVTSVDVTTTSTKKPREYRIGAVKVKSLGRWTTVDPFGDDELSLPRGRYFKVRVRLEPASAKSGLERTYREFTIKAPTTYSVADLSVFTGDSDYWYDDEDFGDYDEEYSNLPALKTIAELVTYLKNQVRNDQVALTYGLQSGKKYTTTTLKRNVDVVTYGENYFTAEFD